MTTKKPQTKPNKGKGKAPKPTSPQPKKPASKPKKEAKGVEIAESSASEPRVIGRPFQKGVSGNPGGLPKGLKELKALAREYTTDAVKTLASIMNNEQEVPAARVAAAKELLDRGYGKSTQYVEAKVDIFENMSTDELREFLRREAAELCIGSTQASSGRGTRVTH
jgi:hypothetical protein